MRSALAIALPALALVTSACGSGGAGANAGGKGDAKAPRIAYLTYTTNDYTTVEVQGATNVAKASGGSVQVFNANFDPQAQLKQCEDAITSGRYDAILVASVDNTAAIPCAKQAAAAKIPLATIETPVGPDPDALQPQVEGVVAASVYSQKTNAEAQVETVRRACAGIDPCKVIVEIASPSDRFTNYAANAVAQAGANVELVAKLVGDYDPSVVAKAMPDVLTAHPDANVFMSASDTDALAALPAIKQAGMLGKLRLLGNGGSRAGAAAIERGTMLATVANYPLTTAEAVTRKLVQALDGGKVAAPGFDSLLMRADGTLASSPLIVDKADVATFAPQWGAE